MFICDVTKKPSAPREPMIKLAVEFRPKVYVNYDPETDEEIISYGEEIVKEIRVTKEGADILEKAMQEQLANLKQ